MAFIASFVVEEGLTFVMYSSHFSNFRALS